MSNTCPTVKVKADNEHGFMVINESDFDAKTHEAFDAEEVAKPTASKAELQAALDAKGIAHKPAMSKAELQALLDAA